MNIKPESSLLFLITLEEENATKLVFAYKKQLNDINPPSNIYWKEEDKNLWEEKSLKEWLVYGSNKKINNLWNSIQHLQKIKLQNKDFVLPTKISETTESNITNIKYDIIDLPQYLLESENLLFIEGYKIDSSGKIKSIKPSGLLPKNFLYEKLIEGYRLIQEDRKIYYHFRGVIATSKDKVPTEMIGFVQADLNNHNYDAEIVNENSEIQGDSLINKENGIFKINLSNPTYKGQFAIKENSEFIERQDYVLIKDINIKTEIIANTFTDSYGRITMIGRELPIPQKPESHTWQEDLFTNDRDRQITLLEYIKTLLNYLGPNILICDPYFFGRIPPESDDEKKSYSVFMNALLCSAIEYKKNEIRFLGFWGRAKDVTRLNNEKEVNINKKQQYFDSLKEQFLSLLKQEELKKHLPLDKIFFINSHKDFHNRYWFGMKYTNGKMLIDENKIFIITNSINNVFNSGEVDFMHCTDRLQIQRVSSKYDSLVQNSTEVFTIG